MRCLLPLLLLCACEPARLVPLPPPPEAGPEAEEGVRPRDPVPYVDAGESCGVELIWPYDFAPLGECSPGWYDECSGDQRAAIGPAPDVCGNGLDEDCDGIIDDGSRDRAMLLLVDVSGSMGDHRRMVTDAVCELATTSTGEQWALAVFGAHPQPDQPPPVWFMAAQFAPGADHVCAWLRSSPWTGWQQYAEHVGASSLEAIDAVTWPADHARHIIAITDEEPQGVPGSQGPGTDLALEACIEAGAHYSVLTRSPWHFYWTSVISGCGGGTYNLGFGVTPILSALRDAAARGC